MNFAVIPWEKRYGKNEIFKVDSTTNRDSLAEPYAELKKYMEAHGHSINTIDICENLDEIDFFLFFEWREEWMDKLIRQGYAFKMVYCNAEPPTVKELNSPEGYKTVHKYFPYIMTWNKDLVDDKVFFYRTIPYTFVDRSLGKSFPEKKLLTSISANKKSDYKDELYSEREELISFFEKEIPEEFDMYGVGWKDSGHSSYKGSPKSKFETYANYKFAIALENTKNVRGYVTEKIFDCLTAGIVPVYMGADDICDYVSEGRFIDYRQFSSKKELLDYLLSVDENQYDEYLKSAKEDVRKLVETGTFSGARYAQNIIDMAMKADQKSFQVDSQDASKLHFRHIKSVVVCSAKRTIKKLIGKD